MAIHAMKTHEKHGTEAFGEKLCFMGSQSQNVGGSTLHSAVKDLVPDKTRAKQAGRPTAAGEARVDGPWDQPLQGNALLQNRQRHQHVELYQFDEIFTIAADLFGCASYRITESKTPEGQSCA